ncbi:hypothetical protein ACLKA6_006553 [Drosophila palustris]
MPDQEENNWSVLRIGMTMLRIFLAWSYLWVLAGAAAVFPVLHREKSKWLFWITNSEYSLTYASLLPFDGFTQGYVVIVMIQMITRLYHCSRCHFFGAADNDHEHGNRNVEPFDKCLLVYFGPYMLLFAISWCASAFYIYEIVLQIHYNLPVSNRTVLYCELAVAIIFKALILANAIVRHLRGIIILKLFNLEPEANLHNEHNFGEHLNLFFQY